MCSEVPLVSLLQNSAVLSHLLNSGAKEDRAITAKLIKLAAVLQQVTAGHGAYAPYRP
jgi:hypothetical protein